MITHNLCRSTFPTPFSKHTIKFFFLWFYLLFSERQYTILYVLPGVIIVLLKLTSFAFIGCCYFCIYNLYVYFCWNQITNKKHKGTSLQCHYAGWWKGRLTNNISSSLCKDPKHTSQVAIIDFLWWILENLLLGIFFVFY